MAIRHPPDDHIPRVARGGRVPQPRVVRYQEPKPRFFRRLLRFLFKPYFVIPVVLLTIAVIAVLAYYWVIFSARIDNLLKGEVFTRSAGIYAAPKQIRAGQGVSQDDLITYLKRAGYVERGQQAESSRGRYAVNGPALEIDPSGDAVVHHAQPFEPLRIQFTQGGKSNPAIADKNSGARLEKSQLEPEFISSVTGHEPAKPRVVGYDDLPPDLVNAITTT